MSLKTILFSLKNFYSKANNYFLQHYPSIYHFFKLLFKSLKDGSIGMRATSISFNFLLAIGPAIIFILSIIPFLPVNDLKSFLLTFLQDIMPQKNYEYINNTINDIFSKRTGLTLFGFFLSIFFTYKGLNGMIDAFNKSIHYKDKRKWLNKQIISFTLVFLLIFLFLISISLFVYNQKFIKLYLFKKFNIYNPLLLNISRWFIIFILTFTTIISLYYLGPSKKAKFKQYIAGSIFATFLCIITSLIFSYFVNNFAPFNKVFGSIGTLIAFLLWMNFNSLALLLGFEINACLIELKNKK